jgi:hypothetical protein
MVVSVPEGRGVVSLLLSFSSWGETGTLELGVAELPRASVAGFDDEIDVSLA